MDACRVRYEFNRPFVEAKDYQENDALAVEATGYALQTIFLMEGGGVTFTQVGRIMKKRGLKSFKMDHYPRALIRLW